MQDTWNKITVRPPRDGGVASEFVLGENTEFRMRRMEPKTDAAGKTVVDASGQPVIVIKDVSHLHQEIASGTRVMCTFALEPVYMEAAKTWGTAAVWSDVLPLEEPVPSFVPLGGTGGADKAAIEYAAAETAVCAFYRKRHTAEAPPCAPDAAVAKKPRYEMAPDAEDDDS